MLASRTPTDGSTVTSQVIFRRTVDDDGEVSSRFVGAFAFPSSSALFDESFVPAAESHLQIVVVTAAQGILINSASGMLSLQKFACESLTKNLHAT